MEGWIKLYRKFLNWEWYKDGNTARVFLHLLLTANHKDKQWKGILIKRGQVLTGRVKLAEALDMSEDQIRTALKHLKATNEITNQTTNKYTLVTLCNFDDYQTLLDDESPTDSPTTSPPNPQQIPTTKNDKKEKEEKKTIKDAPKKRDPKRITAGQFEEFWKLYPGKKVDKGKCLSKWKTICGWKTEDPPTWSQIRIAISEQSKTSRWKKGMIPHPHTWLNQRRWLDDPAQMNDIDYGKKQNPRGAKRSQYDKYEDDGEPITIRK